MTDYYVRLYRKGPVYGDVYSIETTHIPPYHEGNVNGQGYVIYGDGPYESLDDAIRHVPSTIRGLVKRDYLKREKIRARCEYLESISEGERC